jgi:hypothetical protein
MTVFSSALSKVRSFFVDTLLSSEVSAPFDCITEIDLTSLTRSQLDPVTGILVGSAVWFLKKTAVVVPIKYLFGVIGGTVVVVRPGILCRLVAEVNCFLGRVLGYKSGTKLGPEDLAPKVAESLLYYVTVYLNNPVGISILVGIMAYFVSDGLKGWIEKLVEYIADSNARKQFRSNGEDYSDEIAAPPSAPLLQLESGPRSSSVLMEENRLLRAQIIRARIESRRRGS